jgi:hypothetical protein
MSNQILQNYQSQDMKDRDKIEKLILDYFKFVNPLPCDEVKIEFCEFFDLYTINIKSENYLDYIRHRRDIQPNSKTVCEEIRYSMENLFPYNFRVLCVVERRDFYKKI